MPTQIVQDTFMKTEVLKNTAMTRSTGTMSSSTASKLVTSTTVSGQFLLSE